MTEPYTKAETVRRLREELAKRFPQAHGGKAKSLRETHRSTEPLEPKESTHDANTSPKAESPPK